MGHPIVLQNENKLPGHYTGRQFKALPRLGIGITTHNRPDELKKCLRHIHDHLPAGAKVVVVDDASKGDVMAPNWVTIHRFDVNVGVAKAKNKCFELLGDCEHIFLFDDDTYPISNKWWEPYINSGEPHLMYIFKDFSTGVKLNDTATIYQDSKITAYSHPRGCMMYFHKSCLEKVGGMAPVFGKYCHEHPDLSNRIYNAGLTRFRYMDISNSRGLFYSGDEHQAVKGTVTGQERRQQIVKNTPVYEGRRYSKEYVPYKSGRDIILTSYFTGVVDPQRGAKWQPDEDQLIPLTKSADKFTLPVIVLHDNEEVDSPYWPKVETSINPYFQRWASYREYLIKNRSELGRVFCVDATDVEVLNNPFPHMAPNTLYTGDEPDTLASTWLRTHHKNPTLQTFMQQKRALPLLNAGLLGGPVDMVIDFCGKMMDIYTKFEEDAQLRKLPNAGMTDMATFNYVAYNFFKPVHGRQVNTVFKKFQTTGQSWFRHK